MDSLQHESNRPDVAGEQRDIWLNGDVLMCACPDCQAPMTVRYWLMLADCWLCGTSIELTEEQEREARRLMAEAGMDSPPPQAAAAAAPVRTRKAVANRRPPMSVPSAPVPRPAADDLAAKQRSVPERVRARMGRPPARRGVAVWLQDAFHATPAWLISLVFHLVLLTLLALWSLDRQARERLITLSTTINPIHREGGDIAITDPDQEWAFDLPLPKDIDLSDVKVREAVVRADQDARELRLDPGVDEPDLPSLEMVKGVLGGRHGAGPGRTLAARDPRIRIDVLRREGGTTMTEAAVARGLRWLALHQEDQGNWSLHRFNHRRGCACSGTGGIRSDAAATSLALLPFLGAGQTHLVGHYQQTVSRGIRWLLDHQKPQGDLRGSSDANAGMYAQGQGTIVLCEAYLMTGDQQLRDAAQRAVDFIVEAQHAAGGWRYSPGQAGDTSVLGWQLMALQSARAAQLTVPEETFELAGQYLDSVSSRGGALYAYLPGQSPTHVMTAEALLCRMYLGWKLEMPALREGVEYLVERHLPRERDPNIYYWYYATQTLHHHGGAAWDAWNARMREILVETQDTRGHGAGSWSPRGDHAGAGGRVYMTALSVCSLEVYYRHLPIFRQLDLDSPPE